MATYATVFLNLIWIVVVVEAWDYSRHGLSKYGLLSIPLYFALWLLSVYLLKLTARGTAVKPTWLARVILGMFAGSTELRHAEKQLQITLAFPGSTYEGESALLGLTIRLSDAVLSDTTVPPEVAKAIESGRAWVQLDAPAFDLTPETAKVELKYATDERTIRWVVLPKVSGNQKVAFRFYDGSQPLYELMRDVRVCKLDGLTSRQVWVLGSTLAVMSGLLGAVNIIWSILRAK